MRRTRTRLLVGAITTGLAAVAVSAFALTGAVSAAAQAKPGNTSPPTISGNPQVGQTLTGSPGTWTNGPTSYDYAWQRCNRDGSGCDTIGGAQATTYTLVAADGGHTIRFRVTAQNKDGETTVKSAPTALVPGVGRPANTSPPTIAGVAQEGKPLTGSPGTWSNNPSDYNYFWLRCGRNGGNCSTIGGAHAAAYTLVSADIGNTVRFRVDAKNQAGTTTATSGPSPVVQRAAPVTPPRGSGCPASGNPDQVSAINAPAHLVVDTLQSDPQVVTSGVGTLIVRFHVTSTCGGPVQGALVYATATPFNQFSIPAETPTGPNGWAELRFQRLSGFPASPHQQLIAFFVRARKPGESLLAGIAARRLVSIRVDLRR